MRAKPVRPLPAESHSPFALSVAAKAAESKRAGRLIRKLHVSTLLRDALLPWRNWLTRIRTTPPAVPAPLLGEEGRNFKPAILEIRA
jgi:hypothetical protein